MNALVVPEDLTEEDAHRRVRVLLALASCMAEKGYRATTISDIARAGRVSKTVVYAHFRDKEHCLLELYTRASDKMLATVHAAQQQAAVGGLTWRERLRTSVRAYLEVLAANPEVAWAALVEVQAAGRPALALRRQVIGRYVELICGVAADLAERHPDEVRPVDRALVLAAVGGLNELMLARVERGEVTSLTDDTEVATEVLVSLVAHHA
ncbi:AcrR family transcriptional regulator [Geodermatophilus bullaregiensis]|uniref:TetR/AcrR family transcriptional regulator n=1 Tax=Geodermatophilus bullaregiensis TaxID=1564160 RepID=UPI00195804C4|nr:TetR/AcrR family transcriptional regulator [Geodermatophilus bullaregiensis]MBM7808711.1 AcrR family transcriptional regulator [Geodermatophilus bullaregiensis]